MNLKIKNYSINFIKEMVPVVMGVLVALLINNWNEERKNITYIDQIYSTINSELQETKEEIEYIIPRQKSLIDSLSFYVNDENMNILKIVRNSDGIQIPKIKINAWKSISNSKIDLLNYNKIARLSDIEEQKEVLKDKTEYLMTYLYSNFYETEKNKKETLKMILIDIIQTENTTKLLIESIEEKEK